MNHGSRCDKKLFDLFQKWFLTCISALIRASSQLLKFPRKTLFSRDLTETGEGRTHVNGEGISDEELLTWNQKGLIQGPQEPLRAFLGRVKRTLLLDPSQGYEAAKTITSELFDFRMDWVEVRISNRGLRIWEAAATWIRPHAMPVITLRRTRRKRVITEEILAHEMLHVMRAHFPNSQFEECMAYCTSKSPWRRALGPIFQASWESFMLLLLYYSAMLVQIWVPGWRGLIPLSLSLVVSMLGLLRLVKKQHTMRKALAQLSVMTPVPLSMLVRLTDEEIKMCAQRRTSEIRAYIKNQNCMRWRAIILAYGCSDFAQSCSRSQRNL